MKTKKLVAGFIVIITIAALLGSSLVFLLQLAPVK